MNKRAYTLMEIMVVTGLIGLLFSGLLSILINSETFWNKGENKIDEQYEARIAMGSIAKDLRESNTYWNISISTSQILFAKPDFNSTGYFNGTTHWVGYKLDPDNTHRLLRKEGDDPYTPVASHIEDLAFACSTDGCVTFNNNTCPANCPRVRVTITTKKDKNFTLVSDVVLRNQFNAAEPSPPGEGEF